MARANPVLVEVTRGEMVESRHRGAVAIVKSDGQTAFAVGDTERLVYPRSAIKPLQAVYLLESGAADAFELTEVEIALACASHNGEAGHVDAVRSWLTRLGFREQALECGTHAPRRKEDNAWLVKHDLVPGPVHNNCSGKHCGHLAVSKYKDLPIENYNQNNHPIQKELINLIENLSNFKIKNIGIDGCTLPNPLIPLKKFALAAAKIVDYKSLNEASDIAKRIFDSCVKFPEITGGSKSVNCALTKLSKGKAFFKNGAEGVFVAIIPEQKSALAVKITDGAARAAEVAIAGLISELKIIDEDQIEKFKKRPVKNSTEQVIGYMNCLI